MAYFLLCMIVLLGLLERILAKEYNVKTEKPNCNLYTAVTCLCALIFFLVNSRGDLRFTMEIVPYALGFAAAFGTASATTIFAIKTGPLSITALVSSYSLLIPTFYGIIFLKDEVHATLFFGLAALFVSLFLINFKKDENLHFEPMWLLYVILAFISNGMCSTVQKMQQLAFDGAYKNEFMIIALVTVTAVLFALGFSRPGNKLAMLKPCIKYGAVTGFANGIMNYLVMVTSAMLPNAVLFPSISAGGIVLTFVCALTIYKEKLSKTQTVGYVLGIAAVVLLNV